MSVHRSQSIEWPGPDGQSSAGRTESRTFPGYHQHRYGALCVWEEGGEGGGGGRKSKRERENVCNVHLAGTQTVYYIQDIRNF